MKVSKKLEYACRAMVQLAKRYDDDKLARLEEIAQHEDVSANFLVQIMNELKHAKVVDSKRGKAGGYRLPARPEEISLYDIVAAVEPALVAAPPQQTGESATSVTLTWTRISAEFEKHLRKTTVATMMDSSSEPMFYI